MGFKRANLVDRGFEFRQLDAQPSCHGLKLAAQEEVPLLGDDAPREVVGFGFQEIERQAMHDMAAAANHIAQQFPQATVVYRPHPFERVETYESLLEKRDNLHLLKIGTVEGWILRAAVIVHRNSTTAIEAACRKPSCVYPGICPNLDTSHDALIGLYRKAREVKGIKKVLVASGVRYDLAVESPEYVEELVTHHVGGYLKIAPEHTEGGPLSKMMKPGIGAYDTFKALFEAAARQAGKKYFLIPYFIAAHPGTTDADMLELALWLKRNNYRADQVQTFLPSPMAVATAMYHSGKDTLRKVSSKAENIAIPKGEKQRRLHKAFLRYHDPKNWPLLREALKNMGRNELIGNGKHHLIPTFQPKGFENTTAKTQAFKTKFTGFGYNAGSVKKAQLGNSIKGKR